MVEIIFGNQYINNSSHPLNGMNIHILFRIEYMGLSHYIYESNRTLYVESQDRLGIFITGNPLGLSEYELDMKIDQKLMNPNSLDEIKNSVTLAIREDIYSGIVDLFKDRLNAFTQKQQNQFFEELKDL